MRETVPPRFSASLMDQAEYLDRFISNQQIQCVMGLDGRIDESRLARAVRLTLDAEPVLGCRFIERFGRPRWQRRDDLDRVGICALEECGSASDLEDRVMGFLTAPGDPRSDPLVRVAALRSEKDTLCVKVDHIASDTGGAREYLYLLCETYSRLAADPGYGPQPDVGGDRGLGQVFKRFGILQRVGALKSGMPPGAAWGFPWKGASHEDRRFEVRRIAPPAFRALKDFGRERGATVNDIVLTAYYRAMMELVGAGPGVSYCVMVPIDLRRYLPGGRAGSVCNLSGQLYPRLERVPGEGFKATLARVTASTEALKTDMPGIGAAMVVAAFTSPGLFLTGRVYARMVAGEIRSGRCNPYLSNLGVLEPGLLDFGDVGVADAYLVSPLMYSPGFLLGISSFNETMTLTVGFSDATRNAPAVERFLDLFQGELASTSS